METTLRKPIPKKLREQVINRFYGKCGYCGQRPEKLQVDHMKPVAMGGTNEIENLMPACASCNNYKIVYDVEGFRRELGEQICRLRKRSVNFRLAERFGLVQLTGANVRFFFETL